MPGQGASWLSHNAGKWTKDFCDVWERDGKGTLQFRFRNPWNLPLSDADYIKDLEEQNKNLMRAGEELKKELVLLKSQK